MMSPKFRTCFDKGVYPSSSGDRFEPEYTARYDDRGVLVLDVIGKKDVYADIQSYADSVDIYSILRRYENGDVEALRKVEGFHADFSKVPNNYQDILNSVIKSQEFFDSLPVDFKSQFDNNFAQFMVSLGDPEFAEKYLAKETVVDSSSDKEVSDES